MALSPLSQKVRVNWRFDGNFLNSLEISSKQSIILYSEPISVFRKLLANLRVKLWSMDIRRDEEEALLNSAHVCTVRCSWLITRLLSRVDPDSLISCQIGVDRKTRINTSVAKCLLIIITRERNTCVCIYMGFILPKNCNFFFPTLLYYFAFARVFARLTCRDPLIIWRNDAKHGRLWQLVLVSRLVRSYMRIVILFPLCADYSIQQLSHQGTPHRRNFLWNQLGPKSC